MNSFDENSVVCLKHSDAGILRSTEGIRCKSENCNWSLSAFEEQLVIQARKDKKVLEEQKQKIEEEGVFLRRMQAVFKRKKLKLVFFGK